MLAITAHAWVAFHIQCFSPSTNSRVSMLAYAAKSCDQAFFFDFPGFQRKKDRLIAVQSNNAVSTRTSLSPGYNNEH